jgi:hypothetical protein
MTIYVVFELEVKTLFSALGHPVISQEAFLEIGVRPTLWRQAPLSKMILMCLIWNVA